MEWDKLGWFDKRQIERTLSVCRWERDEYTGGGKDQEDKFSYFIVVVFFLKKKKNKTRLQTTTKKKRIKEITRFVVGCVFTLVKNEFIHLVKVFFCMWSRSSCKTLMRPCSNLRTSSRCDMVIALSGTISKSTTPKNQKCGRSLLHTTAKAGGSFVLIEFVVVMMMMNWLVMMSLSDSV